MFKTVDVRLSLLRGDMNDMKKTQTLRHEKYNCWYFGSSGTTHMLGDSLAVLTGLITTEECNHSNSLFQHNNISQTWGKVTSGGVWRHSDPRFLVHYRAGHGFSR